MTVSSRTIPAALLMAGLGGALLSSSILAGATLLLAIAGGVFIARKAPEKAGWDTPKELRLLHFAFWFFVLVSVSSWLLEGFDDESAKTLGTHARFLLFWPLVIALSHIGLRANTLFAAFGLASLSGIIAFGTSIVSHEGTITSFPDGYSSGGAGNLALLGGVLTLIGASLFFRSGKKGQALVFAVLGVAAVATGSGSLMTCCSGLAQGDLYTSAASRGTPGALSWALLTLIPLTLFARHLFSKHLPAAHLAAAGVLVSVGYLFFGLTQATFNDTPLLTFYLLAIAGIASALFHELGASYVRSRTCTVSATVITMNEEAHIADCLKSARLVADEIIVLDSGSSDRTAEIAREYADVVEVTDWPGFGVQKQRALEKATGDWVLSLDADERITPELAREINHHLADPDADAYKLPWAVTIYGKRLDFGRSGRAPLRLFRREGVSFSDALVHERILIPEGRTVKTLRGRLTHYTHRDFGHSLEKSAKYAWLGAQEKYRKGKKTRTMIYPTLRGLMTFIQVYFIRFGFLDGSVGYLTAVTYAQVTFNKYAGLWTLGRPASGSRQE